MSERDGVRSRVLNSGGASRHRVLGVRPDRPGIRVSGRSSSSLLERLLDLLSIFRRPIPAPVRLPRRAR